MIKLSGSQPADSSPDRSPEPGADNATTDNNEIQL